MKPGVRYHPQGVALKGIPLVVAGLLVAATASAAAPPACSTPTIATAEVGIDGGVLVAGSACPGARVELYTGAPRALTPQGAASTVLDDLHRVGGAVAGDCGTFAATLPEMPLGSMLTASAEGADGASGFAAPRGVVASQFPEATIETPEGTVVIRLLADVAPNHVRHFIQVALAGGFDGTLFHRVVPGELVQGGDPTSRDPKKAHRYGSGGLGSLKAEFSDRCFSRGTMGAVRCPSNCDTGGSQFFFCLGDHPELNGQYTAFGEVLAGMDVLDRISRKGTDQGALERIPMKVTIRQPKRL
jgi:peptidyl-prolyl cis-trans isomerase B (cyclophilin B)